MEFARCNFKKCLADLGLGQRFHEIPNPGLRAFRFAGNQPQDAEHKWKLLERIVGKQPLNPIHLSAREAPLRLVIFKLLQNLNSKILVSNEIEGSVSLHLANQNPLRILHLLLVYYDLEIQEQLSVYTLIPGENLGSSGYRVPSAP